MAGASVAIDTKEVLSLKKKLDGLSLSADERVELLGELGTEVQEQTRERFHRSNGQKPDGGDWADIADTTKEYYKKNGIGGSLLMRSGGLYDSIQRATPTPDYVQVGSSAEWAAPHQYGMKKKGRQWGDIPARPFLGINSDDEEDLGVIVDNFIRRKLG